MLNESHLQTALRKLNAIWHKSDRVYRWMLTIEQGRPHIKRNIRIATGKKTFQRLPRRFYEDLSDQELKDLVTRLNYNQDREKRLRERFKINSAFIPSQYLQEFHAQLSAEIPTPEVVEAAWSQLERHFLRYFIQFDPNPVVWQKEYQVKWCNYLLGLKVAPRSLRSIVQIANRFIRFLNQKQPNEVPLLEFAPISRARFRLYRSEWLNRPDVRKRAYITEKDYELIVKSIPTQLRSVFILCYKFGPRRGEALGLYQRSQCVKKGCLIINEQVRRYTREHTVERGPTKGRLARKVPYWYSSPEEAYELVQSIVMLAPDECSRQFNSFCKSIKLDFTLHDCRHTFVTNAVNNKDLRLNEVRLAVGHTDLRVTSGYLRDNTDYDDDAWIPKAS